MTKDQALQFIARYQGAKNFVKQSHLEELSPLLECHIEAIEAKIDEFHDIQGAFMPRKETMDKFAQAAGVSYNATAETTRKEGDGCFVGTAQAMVMGPDGKMIMGPICEYEFDVDVRLEEMKLSGKSEWKNGQKSTREYTPLELAKERIQLMKVARMRANTGARNRATVAILGMQTGFKNLFPKGAPATAGVTFLFSRVIVNAKNEMVLSRMLDNLAGPTQALFGPQPALAITGKSAPQPDPRNVTGSADEWPEDNEDPRIGQIMQLLSDWTMVEDQRVAKRAQALIDRGEMRIPVLESALAIIQYMGSGATQGLKSCADALDMDPLDPIVLSSLAAKVKGSAA